MSPNEENMENVINTEYGSHSYIAAEQQRIKELYRLKVFGGKVYFLAAELDGSEQKTNKENEADGSEK